MSDETMRLFSSQTEEFDDFHEDGWSLGVTVGPDGTTWPVLWAKSVTEPTPVPYRPSHFRGVADHEQVGPLPPEIQARIDSIGGPARCGSPRADGRPCRMLVHRTGDHCRHHAGPAPEPQLPLDLEPRRRVTS